MAGKKERTGGLVDRVQGDMATVRLGPIGRVVAMMDGLPVEDVSRPSGFLHRPYDYPELTVRFEAFNNEAVARAFGVPPPHPTRRTPSVTTAEAVKPEPIDIQSEFDQEFAARYRAASEKLGFRCAKIGRDAILGWFKGEGIPIYAEPQVVAWMNSKFGEIGVTEWDHRTGRSRESWSWWPLTGNQESAFRTKARAYAEPIPLQVLETAALVKDRFPTAEFEVAAPGQAAQGDPFMAALIDGERFIFAMWDEPGFGQEAAKGK